MAWIRDRALTLVLMAMFLLCLAGQLATGLAEYNSEQVEHGEAAVSVGGYLATGHPWEALFENWESEFLQMAVFVLLTTFLVQKGSPESRRPGVKELVDTDPRDFADDPDAPWPVRRGGWILRLYEHSLGLAFVVLFLIAWVGHALGGFAEFAADRATHRLPRPALTDYLMSARSGSNRSRTGRASFSRSPRWSGSRCTSDSDGRRSRNRCMRRMPKQDIEGTYADVNAVVGGYLRDLAFAQSGSTRVIREILETGGSPTVEQAIERSERRADIQRRRELRRHFLSRAEVRRILADSAFDGPTVDQYRGDLQMHSEWSDGSPTVQEIADACVERGYQYAAVTDHSYGLRIAGGMSMAEAAAQRLAIDGVNARYGGRFRLLQGIEANIDAAGHLDLTDEEAATFDVVLAAPHSRLRKNDDQTDRMLTALQQPAVRILAHPRGRISGSRAGVIANWDAVFEAAAQRGVAIEIDGDPARQDLDFTMGRRALAFGCVFALDSDAHTTGAAVLCRDRTGARAAGRHSRRQNRQLLAAGPTAGLVVGSILRVRPLSALGADFRDRDGRLVDSARRGVTLRGDWNAASPLLAPARLHRNQLVVPPATRRHNLREVAR